MAKCKECDYPYATGKVCPNCGCENPGGKMSANNIIVLIVIIVIAVSYCK